MLHGVLVEIHIRLDDYLGNVIFLLLIPFKNGDTPEYQRDDDTSEDSKQNPNKEA